MGDDNRVPRRKPVPAPPSQPLAETWATDLTSEFRRVLSTKRMNELSKRPSSQRRISSRLPTEIVTQSRSSASTATSPMSHTQSHSGSAALASSQSQPQDLPQSPPPSYSSLRNIPIVPTAPSDNKSLRFRSLLMNLSNTPCKWENPGLLDEALRVIPLQRIYDEAQEEADLFAAEAASLGPQTRAAWGYQDCIVRALMKWFKREFFDWVSNPKCSLCYANTVGTGMVAPLPDESARGANRVELYQCSNPRCLSFERFPRYNDAFVLLQTRRGRVGEWASCFTMLCRAIGSRVRWVWNSEDHVWTEVYSTHRRRWVHADACEEAWDAPLLYTQGWKKRLAYCIAFSADGCQDVTRRYVRSPADHALPRTKCPEGVLIHIINEIKALRRRDMDKQERFRLNTEDMKEDTDFRRMIIEALAYNVSCILPGGDACSDKGKGAHRPPRPDPDAQKAAESRHEERQRSRVPRQQPPHRNPPPPPPHDRDQPQ